MPFHAPIARSLVEIVTIVIKGAGLKTTLPILKLLGSEANQGSIDYHEYDSQKGLKQLQYMVRHSGT